MVRPLIVTDCDEVLLHMIAPFRDWLDEAHDIDFSLDSYDFSRAMTRRSTGEVVTGQPIWDLLDGFFDTEMHRQSPIAGAIEAIGRLQEKADVVVLTNLGDHRRESRARQLSGHGLSLRVETNQGPKGPALARIVAEFAPARAFFIDDLPQHHASAMDSVPHVTRLHLCGEPLLGAHIPCAHLAGHAHARIDEWDRALPWLLEQLEQDSL